QILTFVVTGNTSPELFQTGPAIDPATGTLTYTPAVGATGTAYITLVLQDNSGTANGGQDTSTSVTFAIAINHVLTARDDGYTIDENIPLTVAAPGLLANDSSTVSDPLSAQLVTGPAHGSLTLNP